jgi:hypothetical protein
MFFLEQWQRERTWWCTNHRTVEIIFGTVITDSHHEQAEAQSKEERKEKVEYCVESDDLYWNMQEMSV